jgi:hypothetical protein
MKSIIFSIIAMASLLATAAQAETKELSCGDHWFAVDVTLGGEHPVVTLSGDSVTGDNPVYAADVFITNQGATLIYSFAFGDSDVPGQSLKVDFSGSEAWGSGVYSSGPDGYETNMNCYRR